jgi:hypothetical protein
MVSINHYLLLCPFNDLLAYFYDIDEYLKEKEKRRIVGEDESGSRSIMTNKDRMGMGRDIYL